MSINTCTRPLGVCAADGICSDPWRALDELHTQRVCVHGNSLANSQMSMAKGSVPDVRAGRRGEILLLVVDASVTERAKAQRWL